MPKNRLNMSRKAGRLVERFRRAAIAMSWMGSRMPEEFEEIEEEYKDAIVALRDYIARLESRQRWSKSKGTKP